MPVHLHNDDFPGHGDHGDHEYHQDVDRFVGLESLEGLQELDSDEHQKHAAKQAQQLIDLKDAVRWGGQAPKNVIDQIGGGDEHHKGHEPGQGRDDQSLEFFEIYRVSCPPSTSSCLIFPADYSLTVEVF